MSWTYITDDPATLPPLDTPVFVLDPKGCISLVERTDTNDGWLWAQCYGAPHFINGKWYVLNAEFEDLNVIAWHPLPELPTEGAP